MKPPDCKGKTKLFFNLLVFCAQDPEMAGDSRKRTPRPPEASLQLAKLPPSSPGAPSYLACPEAASANHHKRGARIEQKCYALSDLKARSPSEVSVLRATPLPASSCLFLPSVGPCVAGFRKLLSGLHSSLVTLPPPLWVFASSPLCLS